MWCSQPSVTPVLQDLKPSGFHKHEGHTWHTGIHADKIFIYINLKKKILNGILAVIPLLLLMTAFSPGWSSLCVPAQDPVLAPAYCLTFSFLPHFLVHFQLTLVGSVHSCLPRVSRAWWFLCTLGISLPSF